MTLAAIDSFALIVAIFAWMSIGYVVGRVGALALVASIRAVRS
jgi:hypothetical protein